MTNKAIKGGGGFIDTNYEEAVKRFCRDNQLGETTKAQLEAIVEARVFEAQQAHTTAEIIAELERLDDVIYDDGRVNWGDPTPESVEEYGKNHADLVLPTRYVHKHIQDRIKELKAKETQL